MKIIYIIFSIISCHTSYSKCNYVEQIFIMQPTPQQNHISLKKIIKKITISTQKSTMQFIENFILHHNYFEQIYQHAIHSLSAVLFVNTPIDQTIHSLIIIHTIKNISKKITKEAIFLLHTFKQKIHKNKKSIIYHYI